MKKQRKSIRSSYRTRIDKNELIESWSAIQIMENWVKLLKTGKLHIKNQERNIDPSCWLTIVIDSYLDYGDEKKLDVFY